MTKFFFIFQYFSTSYTLKDKSDYLSSLVLFVALCLNSIFLRATLICFGMRENHHHLQRVCTGTIWFYFFLQPFYA